MNGPELDELVANLEQEGYEVVPAADGQQGRSTCSAQERSMG